MLGQHEVRPFAGVVPRGKTSILGTRDQTSKIVRLGLLRKPLAFRNPIAIPFGNVDFEALGRSRNIAQTFVCPRVEQEIVLLPGSP